MDHIHRSAIEAALRDYSLISVHGPREVKPNEDQARCAMYALYRQHGYVVHAEARYPSSADKCDLRVHRDGVRESWIEIKTTWYASGWINKPSEQLRQMTADIEKLKGAPLHAVRLFALFGFFDREPLETKFGKDIEGLCPKRLTFDSGNREFRWRTENFSTMRAWLWRFPTESTRESER